MSDKLKALGLCLGASTVSIVELELDRSRPIDPAGNPRTCSSIAFLEFMQQRTSTQFELSLGQAKSLL